MSVVPLNNYSINNGSTNSTRILDISFTNNNTAIQNLRSIHVDSVVKDAYAYSMDLSYNTWDCNRLVPHTSVFNALTDQMIINLVTTNWDFKIDYSLTSITPEFKLRYGGTPVNLALTSRVVMEINDQMLHPSFEVEFLFV